MNTVLPGFPSGSLRVLWDKAPWSRTKSQVDTCLDICKSFGSIRAVDSSGLDHQSDPYFLVSFFDFRDAMSASAELPSMGFSVQVQRSNVPFALTIRMRFASGTEGPDQGMLLQPEVFDLEDILFAMLPQKDVRGVTKVGEETFKASFFNSRACIALLSILLKPNEVMKRMSRSGEWELFHVPSSAEEEKVETYPMEASGATGEDGVPRQSPSGATESPEKLKEENKKEGGSGGGSGKGSKRGAWNRDLPKRADYRERDLEFEAEMEAEGYRPIVAEDVEACRRICGGLRTTHDSKVGEHVNSKDLARFQIKLSAVQNGRDVRQSLMIRGLPRDFLVRDLLFEVKETYAEANPLRDVQDDVDYLYVPPAPTSVGSIPPPVAERGNQGIAFVHLVNQEAVVRFVRAMEGKKWSLSTAPISADSDNSRRCGLSYAKVQGVAAMVNQFGFDVLKDLPLPLRPLVLKNSEAIAGSSLLGVEGKKQKVPTLWLPETGNVREVQVAAAHGGGKPGGARLERPDTMSFKSFPATKAKGKLWKTGPNRPGTAKKVKGGGSSPLARRSSVFSRVWGGGSMSTELPSHGACIGRRDGKDHPASPDDLRPLKEACCIDEALLAAAEVEHNMETSIDGAAALPPPVPPPPAPVADDGLGAERVETADADKILDASLMMVLQQILTDN